jgi:hypothetical protein
MARLKLTVNERKTHVCRVPEQYFNFLGYQFGRFYLGRAYLGGASQSTAARLGQLFQARPSEPGISISGPIRYASATPVVAPETQGALAARRNTHECERRCIERR